MHITPGLLESAIDCRRFLKLLNFVPFTLTRTSAYPGLVLVSLSVSGSLLVVLAKTELKPRG